MSDRAPKIFSIAPHAPFLDTLARAIIDGTLVPNWPRTGPFWLADMTIYLPTRRAATALARQIAELTKATPLLLPDIRPLGGDDPTQEPFLPPYEAVSLPQPINRLHRRLMLAQLIEKWLAAQPGAPFSAPALGGFTGRPNAAEVLALADSLGTVIDDFAIAGIDPAALKSLDDANLPEGWQAHLDFVSFVLDHWPAILDAEGAMEGAGRTNTLLDRKAKALYEIHGDKPVIVAGSTGSIPATARLIAAIAHLPNGAVVLPGLDRGLTPVQVDTLRTEHANPHGHPQYGLVKLLRHLGGTPVAVEPLGAPASARTTMLNAALALAPDTVVWPDIHAALGPSGLADATDGLSIAVARTPEEEARAIALAVCAGLDAHKTVAVISPDQNLARRITAELERFDVVTDDPAGTPLVQTRTGRLVRQIVTAIETGFAPVDLMALLRNRHVVLGLTRADVAIAADWLDFALLRGQRPGPGLSGLRAATHANLAKTTNHPALRLDEDKAERILALLDALESTLEPLNQLFAAKGFYAAQFGLALAQALERVRASADPDGLVEIEGMDALARWTETLALRPNGGPLLDAASLPVALDGLLAGSSVRPRRSGAEDVLILGRLEARLISADLVIVSGLIEGVWPEIADPGPWLNRTMRMGAGLEPPEKLHGLAAHDFYMAMGAPQVLVTFSERSGTSPATPSRLIQRIEAFVGEEITRAMRTRGHHWIDCARRLDLTGAPPDPATRPSPRPPVSARPSSISITEAETLLRSPYDLYAKYGLKLFAVPALGADPDMAERGSILHDILGDFIIAHGNDVHRPDAHDLLMDLARERFASLEVIPDRRDIWLARFAHTAQLFLDFERGRLATRHAEIKGTLAFSGRDFTLRGRADRIDILPDGTLDIIDFKSGSVPDPAEMVNFLAPQLPLEAAMARAGAFGEHLSSGTGALTYIKISNKPGGFEEKPFKSANDVGPDQVAEETFARFSRHVDALLLSDALPMTARVFPKPKQRFKGDYEHLARTSEWTLIEADDGEGDA